MKRRAEHELFFVDIGTAPEHCPQKPGIGIHTGFYNKGGGVFLVMNGRSEYGHAVPFGDYERLAVRLLQGFFVKLIQNALAPCFVDVRTEEHFFHRFRKPDFIFCRVFGDTHHPESVFGGKCVSESVAGIVMRRNEIAGNIIFAAIFSKIFYPQAGG